MVRALEDAGYGLQVVDDDRGRHYVGYSRRVAETETGEVTDYRLAVGPVVADARVHRRRRGHLPGLAAARRRAWSACPTSRWPTRPFAEQGGTPRSFVSGTRGVGATEGGATMDSVDVRAHDALPPRARTPSGEVIAGAREHAVLASEASQAPELGSYAEYRRTVLIFDDPETSFLGASNKRAVRMLVREVGPGDLLVIRSCRDFDGRDDAAMRRGVRVEEELVGLGVAPRSAWIAPCAGASYRHASDDSPVPVELVHYRPRAGATPAG